MEVPAYRSVQQLLLEIPHYTNKTDEPTSCQINKLTNQEKSALLTDKAPTVEKPT